MRASIASGSTGGGAQVRQYDQLMKRPGRVGRRQGFAGGQDRLGAFHASNWILRGLPRRHQNILSPPGRPRFPGLQSFGMASIMQDRVYLMPRPEELWRHLKRRGQVFVDGRRLEQVELYQGLARTDGAFWCEQDGSDSTSASRRRRPGSPRSRVGRQEQVFAPGRAGWATSGSRAYFGARGQRFPRAQRGLVSLSADITGSSRTACWGGQRCRPRYRRPGLGYGAAGIIGHAIVRRNHIAEAGVCGIAGMAVQNTLIDSNLIEHVGYQDVELAWETGGIKLHSTRTACSAGTSSGTRSTPRRSGSTTKIPTHGYQTSWATRWKPSAAALS